MLLLEPLLDLNDQPPQGAFDTPGGFGFQLFDALFEGFFLAGERAELLGPLFHYFGVVAQVGIVGDDGERRGIEAGQAGEDVEHVVETVEIGRDGGVGPFARGDRCEGIEGEALDADLAGFGHLRQQIDRRAAVVFRLPRAIGQAAAMEAILTGEPIPAQRAFELGLVSRLSEPGGALDEALVLAAQITACAPMAVWESRAVVLAAATESDETLKRLTDDAIRRVMSSDDLPEGLTAFIEKRAPNWTGR